MECRGLLVSRFSFVVTREYGLYADVDGRIWALEAVGTFAEAGQRWVDFVARSLKELFSTLAGSISM